MIYRVNNIFEDPPNRGKFLKNLLFCLIVVVFLLVRLDFLLTNVLL